MRNANFSRLQAVLVDDVLFGGEHEPYGLVMNGAVFGVGLVIISYESFLGRGLFLLLLFRIDMSQQCGGSFLNLKSD